MYTYNVSVQVPKSRDAEWTSYMLNGHIDAVLASACFQSAQLSKLHHAQQHNNDDYTTYVVQYTFESMTQYEAYQLHHAPALQNDHKLHFGDSCLAFRSVLEIISHKKSR